MKKLWYDCKHCNRELNGTFGENVYCKNCDITYTTDYDYIDAENIQCWLLDEFKGKININEWYKFLLLSR